MKMHRQSLVIFFVLILSAIAVLATAATALAIATKNIAVSKVTSTSAVIVIETDVASDVTVDYGQASGVYTGSASGTNAIRHEIALSSLIPSANVFYRLTITDAADPATSITIPEKFFHTAHFSGEPFSFAAAGDHRPNSDTTVQPAMWGTIVGQMTGEGLDLALNVGDIIYGTGSDSLAQNVAKYQGMFAVTTQLTSSTPMYVAAGNHERLNYADSRAGFEQEFTFPVNNGASAATEGEHYYSFDNGDTHFIALSTEIPGQEGMITGSQKAWLEQDLAANEEPWIVVFMHRPLFSGQHGGDPWVNLSNTAGQQNKADIHALFLQYGVDVVLEGHDHYYLRHVEDGIQYIITGGGGAPVSGTPALGPGDVFGAGVYEHVKVDETSSSLTISALDSTGVTLESFALTMPELSLTLDKAYWANLADYQNNVLSANFTLVNSGAGGASNINVESLSASGDVAVLTSTPFSLGSLAASASMDTTVTYQVPQGVATFLSTFRATCTDDRGFTYAYP